MFAVAEFLYESRWGWQTKLAGRLRVDSRTVRRWISGQDRLDPTAWELMKLLVAWKALTGALPETHVNTD